MSKYRVTLTYPTPGVLPRYDYCDTKLEARKEHARNIKLYGAGCSKIEVNMAPRGRNVVSFDKWEPSL